MRVQFWLLACTSATLASAAFADAPAPAPATAPAAAAAAPTPAAVIPAPPSVPTTGAPTPPAASAPTNNAAVAPSVPTTSAPAIAPIVDPKVKTILDEVLAAQEAVNSVTATLSVDEKVDSDAHDHTVMIAFSKPCLAKASIDEASGPDLQFTYDCKTYTGYSPRDKQYAEKKVDSSDTVITNVLNKSKSLLVDAYAEPESFVKALTRDGSTQTVGTPGTVHGTPTDTVIVDLPPLQGAKVRMTCAFGKTDHLLRQVVASMSGVVNGAQHNEVDTETVTDLDLNPTLKAADFAFTPPAGSQDVSNQEGSDAMYDSRLAAGATPFAFNSIDLNGKPISLSDYAGKAVILEFWATWCGPCRAEMPSILAAYKTYHAKGLDVIGISLDTDEPSLKSFVTSKGIPWRQIYGGQSFYSPIPVQYGVKAIPLVIVVGRDGKIVDVNPMGDDLDTAIQKALAAKPPTGA